MSLFVQGTRVLLLAAVICGGSARVNAHPNGSDPNIDATAIAPLADRGVAHGSEDSTATRAFPPLAALTPSGKDHGRTGSAITTEPFGLEATAARPNEISAKWMEVQTRILAEQATIAACRAGASDCPVAVRKFLEIVEIGRQHQGRARLGLINRAVNLSIRPVSDLAQYGVDDYWAAPLATLSAGAGDCEDYAIVKYAALREAGIAPDDLRLVIVRNMKSRGLHAVVAVRHEEEWLILDNRLLLMLNAQDARHYFPLFVLDHRGVREPAITAFRY